MLARPRFSPKMMGTHEKGQLSILWTLWWFQKSCLTNNRSLGGRSQFLNVPVPPPIVGHLAAFRSRKAMRPTPNRSAIADGAGRRSPSRVVRMVRRTAPSSFSRRKKIVCSRDRPRVHSRISVRVPRGSSRFLGAQFLVSSNEGSPVVATVAECDIYQCRLKIGAGHKN